MSDEIKITVPDNHFECVLVAALRYSIGRRTYMPELVTNFIKGYCAGKLSKHILEVMIRDIDTASSLGDGCDIETWLSFKAWLEKEAEENAT